MKVALCRCAFFAARRKASTPGLPFATPLPGGTKVCTSKLRLKFWE